MLTPTGVGRDPPERAPPNGGGSYRSSWSYLIVLVVIGIVYAIIKEPVVTNNFSRHVIRERRDVTVAQDHVPLVAPMTADPLDENSPQPRSSDWLVQAQKNHEAESLKPREVVGKQGVSYEFRNRGHKLESIVDESGWEIRAADDSLKDSTQTTSSGWTWRYSLDRIVRGTSEIPIGLGTLSSSGGTVMIARSSEISEWYINKPEGIEQGFTITQRPHQATQGTLVLRGAVDTDLKVSTSGRDVIAFKHGGEDVLRYAGLKVTDASGRGLPTWLTYSVHASGENLDILIDDAQAVYPLTVDPVASSAAWTGEGNPGRC